MNNFFLLNEALSVATIMELEQGISNLNEVVIRQNKKTDVLLRHESLWQHNTGHGTVVDLYFSVVAKEVQRLVPKVFEVLSDYPNYIATDVQFDGYYPNDCNGFLGIDFSATTIPLPRQVTSSILFGQFKSNCIQSNAYSSIQNFWAARQVLFPNLVFCDRVFDQISHLQVTDDRFKLINAKLTILDQFTGKWSQGPFDFKSIGLNCSPDTPTRVTNTLTLRTFNCPQIGNRVFDLHIKWSVGREFFRLYFFPEPSNRKVYVGYIGPKDEIGF